MSVMVPWIGVKLICMYCFTQYSSVQQKQCFQNFKKVILDPFIMVWVGLWIMMDNCQQNIYYMKQVHIND